MLTLPWLLALVAAPPQGERAFVHASTVNVRARPSAKAPIAGKLAINQPVFILSRGTDGWCSVRSDALQGSVKCDLLGATELTARGLLDQLDEGAGRMPPQERLAVAERALALAPLDGDVLDHFMEALLAGERARFLELEKQGKLKVVRRVMLRNCTEARDRCLAASHPSLKSIEAGDYGNVVMTSWSWGGKLHMETGHFGTMVDPVNGKTIPTFDVMLAYAQDASPEKRRAFESPVTNPAAACMPPVFTQYDVPACAYEQDQNCSPDRCWDKVLSCREPCKPTCSACVSRCAPACSGCVAACGGDKACVANCASDQLACVQGCHGAALDCEARCSEPYAECSKVQSAWWKGTCEKPCQAWIACVNGCTTGECRKACPQLQDQDCAYMCSNE